MRRIVVLAVGLLVLQAPVAQADPDVTVRCGGGIRARLVLDRPDRIRLRFILHGSAPGDRWTIWIHRAPGIMGGPGGHMVFHDTRVASDSGDFVMQRTFLRRRPLPIFGVTARDWQTNQECRAGVWGPEEQAVPALAAPDVVRQRTCSDGAISRLELTHIRGTHWIKVRFEVHRSPVGHSWRIVIPRLLAISNVVVSFRGTRVASDSGDLAVQRRVVYGGGRGAWARAHDRQTGQSCKVDAHVSSL